MRVCVCVGITKSQGTSTVAVASGSKRSDALVLNFVSRSKSTEFVHCM